MNKHFEILEFVMKSKYSNKLILSKRIKKCRGYLVVNHETITTAGVLHNTEEGIEIRC